MRRVPTIAKVSPVAAFVVLLLFQGYGSAASSDHGLATEFPRSVAGPSPHGSPFPGPAGSATLPVNLELSPSSMSWAGEPSLSVNRYGTLMASWMEGSNTPFTSFIGAAVSNTSGATFASPFQLPHPNPGTDYMWDTSATGASPNGTFSVGFGADYAPCGGTPSIYTSQFYVERLWSNGSHMGTPQVSLPCTQVGLDADREWVASSPNGTVYQEAWADPSNVIIARSFAGGPFGPVQNLSLGSFISSGAMAYNGSEWGFPVTTFGTGAAEWNCSVVLSQDSGSSWSMSRSAPAACGAALGTDERSWYYATGFGPAASIDMIYVLNGSGIEFTRSTDMGVTWSSPVLISGVVSSSTGFIEPAIATDPGTGAIACLWLDTRSDPSADAWVVYEVDSPDNGTSWGPVRMLSDGTVYQHAIPNSFLGPWEGPQDFTSVILTPWGTAAGAWGGDPSDPAGYSASGAYFGQAPLIVPRSGNLTVQVVSGQGHPWSGAEVQVAAAPARTGPSGKVEFFALRPGSYPVQASIQGVGTNGTAVSVSAGSNGSVTLCLGTGCSTIPPLVVSSFRASPASVNVGRTTFLNVSATGGFGALTYAYTALPPGCSTRSTDSLACSPTTTGSYLVRVYVNDSLTRSDSNTTGLTVDPAPTPPSISGFVAVPPSVEVGRWTNLTVSATGGTGVISYSYAGLPDGCTSLDLAILACRPSSTGSFMVRVYANDSVRQSASSSTTLTVLPSSSLPTLSSVLISPPSDILTTGSTAPLVASLTCVGGSCPGGAAYDWTLSNARGTLNATSGPLVSLTVGPATGILAVFVNASLNGRIASAYAEITVTAEKSCPSCGPGGAPQRILGLSPPIAEAMVAGAAIALAASILAVLSVRRRRSRRRDPPAPIAPERSSEGRGDEHEGPSIAPQG
jgi:hypothetical protein